MFQQILNTIYLMYMSCDFSEALFGHPNRATPDRVWSISVDKSFFEVHIIVHFKNPYFMATPILS